MGARPFALLVLAPLVALAGCLGGFNATPVPPTPGPGDPADAVSFTAPVAVGPRVGEPGLRIAADGTIWAHAPGGLWKSVDNGSSFEEVPIGPGVVVGGDADLAIGKDGALYYTDLQDLVAISVFTSKDNGKTWFENPVASDMVLDDRQWIEAGPDAGPTRAGEAVYLVYNNLPTNVWLSKSVDQGVTWVATPVVLPTDKTQLDFWTMGNLVIDAEGVIFVAYTLGWALDPVRAPGQPASQFSVSVSVSRDGGLTFERKEVAAPASNPGNLFPILAKDEADNVYLTWAGAGDDGQVDVWLSRTSDAGATWSPPLKVTTGPGTHVMPWVDAGAPGVLRMAWYETDEVADPNEVEGDWYVAFAEVEEALSDEPVVRVTRVGEPMHSGKICTFGIMCRGGRELLDFFQVRMDARGMSHVIYPEGTGSVAVQYVKQLTGAPGRTVTVG